ncbi:DsbA family protein [Cohnella caldifontis]|uniref:DsbA family protein n=1 Tax=Cohnella caldifontis TaxID=3027471 RepID=UPI0023EC36BD|nr:thioredoxin domain-containing protein [Cohnella sp. YIM B05605]
MEKTKAQLKKEERILRQIKNEKKKRRSRVMVWSATGLFAVLIAALIVFWPKPGPMTFDYGSYPTLGSADAKVKLMEFGDFKCPTCKYFSEDIMSKIKTEYIDTGKVSLSFQNWTIIWDDSYTAALAGLSVFHQNKDEFWKFYDVMYLNQKPEEKVIWATTDYLVDLAKQAGVNVDYDKLRQDIDQQTYADELDGQNAYARKHNFTGTPTVILNGEKLDDDTALSYDNFKKAIDKALQESES